MSPTKPLTLAGFDPGVVAEYGITADDLRRVERYLRLLQGPDAPALADIAIGGYYGTAALLHEVVELRVLLKREPRLLNADHDSARSFSRSNRDAHLSALKVEYTYLQHQIRRILDEEVEIGTLVWANADDSDFYLLVESDWPDRLFVPDAVEIGRARWLLTRLKEVGL